MILTRQDNPRRPTAADQRREEPAMVRTILGTDWPVVALPAYAE